MLIFAKFTNAEDLGLSYTFINEADTGFGNHGPMTNLAFRTDERTVTDRYRMQQHGAYPTFSYTGGLHIDVNGDLMRDTSENYVTERRSLTTALRGVPDTIPTVRKRGVFELQWAGDDESAKADVTLEEVSLPLEALSPSRTTYLITFFSFKPWFTGSTSGDLYYFD